MNTVQGRPRLILASSSPRRKELLTLLGLTFTVVKPEVEEVRLPGEEAKAYTLRNARLKGEWVFKAAAAQEPGAAFIVISADTIVVLGSAVLEKPRDEAEAKAMLRSLSGRTHTVITGVSMLGRTREEPTRLTEQSLAVETAVTIKPLTERDIAAYVATGEPMDKAGAYAAQGIGSHLIARIDGSYTNVVGLPLTELVASMAADFSYALW